MVSSGQNEKPTTTVFDGPIEHGTKNYDFSWTRKSAIDQRKDLICCSDFSVRRQPRSQDQDGYVASAAHGSMSHPAAFLSLYRRVEFQLSRFVKYLSCAASNLQM